MADGDVLVPVVSYDEEVAARQAARSLVEAGIGAQVGEGVGGDDGGSPAPTWQVEVLPEDVSRACGHLGVDPPGDPVDDHEAAKSSRRSTVVTILVIWAIAMVVLPLAAFWLTVRLNS